VREPQDDHRQQQVLDDTYIVLDAARGSCGVVEPDRPRSELRRFRLAAAGADAGGRRSSATARLRRGSASTSTSIRESSRGTRPSGGENSASTVLDVDLGVRWRKALSGRRCRASWGLMVRRQDHRSPRTGAVRVALEGRRCGQQLAGEHGAGVRRSRPRSRRKARGHGASRDGRGGGGVGWDQAEGHESAQDSGLAGRLAREPLDRERVGPTADGAIRDWFWSCPTSAGRTLRDPASSGRLLLVALSSFWTPAS